MAKNVVNINDWIVLKEAAEVFERSSAVIQKDKQRGHIKARKKLGKNYLNVRDMVKRYGKPPVAKLVNKKIEDFDYVPPEEHTAIIPDRGSCDFSEASRVLKVEQAIAKQRENLLSSGKVLFAKDILRDAEDIFTIVWEFQRELIDKWQIEYNLSEGQTQEMHQQFNAAIKRASDKIKEKMKV